MFTVSTTLYTRDEIVLHANFALALAQLRDTGAVITTNEPAVEIPLEPGACGTQTGPVTVTGAEPIPEQTPEQILEALARPVEPLDLSQMGVERSFRAFITAKGAAAARAILDEFKAPRLGDVKESDLPLFVTKLTVTA